MKEFIYVTIFLIQLSWFANGTDNITKRPHIIFILADDLGFNDVGFRGSSQIPTPNIDALAYSGLILNRYYVTPICTPSRSALMTGKYPIHTGMQHTVLYGAEPRGLPLHETLLPEYLNKLGYYSHIAGKWHLGNYKLACTPLYRGFRTHVGFWTGHHDYNDHTAMEKGMWGLDIRDGVNIGYHLHGQYTTDIVTNEALRVITDHNTTNPLFLYVAHSAVHSGNPYNPLAAPDAAVSKLANIKDYNRRRFGAVLSQLDDSVGRIVDGLARKGMLNDSIIVFSTDNGGPAEGFNLNFASNWPLRGVKNTLWEGGVRGVGLLWYPKLKKSKRIAEQTIHISDWLPTLMAAAGGEHLLSTANGTLDGVNVWNALSNDEISPRKNILHNIDDIWGSAAVTVGDWKLVKGTNYNGAWDGWYGPAGDRNPKIYETKKIYRSLAGRAIVNLKLMPSNAKILQLRANANVNCSSGAAYLREGELCNPLVAPCLFNIKDDPCERHNLAHRYLDILKVLSNELETFNRTALPPANKDLDPKGDPKYNNHVWTNFGDNEFVRATLSNEK